VARPRSDAWLWILNAVVIGTVIIAAAAAATTTGHTVVAGTDHFLLYYAGVLALIALTAEVGIGLVASDRIFMKPSARVTAQALHRAMGFGAIAFLVIHIVLEIIAGRSQPADAVIPFLDKGRTFYLGLGTVAFDIFIVIMMTGIYRARLAANMSPKAWRVIHASAYAAWIFGLVHGLLAGRPAKAFFGFSGFVYWAYGACVVAVAVALMVRMVAKNRAGNELASHPVADSGGTGGWSAAAALTSTGALSGGAALTATAMQAPALTSGSPGALDGARSRASRPSGRAQLALPAGASAASPRGRGRGAPYDERAAYLAENRRMGASDPIGPGATGSFERGSQFGGPGADPRDWASEYEPTGPMPRVAPHTGPVPRVAAHGHTGPRPRVARHEQTGPMPRVDQYEQGGYQYERTGQIDRSGQYERPQPGPLWPGSQQPGQMYGDPLSGGPVRRDLMQRDQMPGGQLPGGRAPGGRAGYGPSAPSPMLPAPPAPIQYGQPMSRQYGETGPYERPHDDWSGPMERIGPSAAAPRYAAGNYDDWSGPLERIDPAAPPSQYGAPAHYDSLAQYGLGQYGTGGEYGVGGQYGGTRHYERPQAEPRYERTGEIDRSGQYGQAQYGQAQYGQSQYGQAQNGQAPYGSSSGQPPYAAQAPQYGGPGYGPPSYGQEGDPGQPMPRQREHPGAYERPHPAQYQQPGGYEAQGQYEMPVRYEEPMQYDQYQHDDQYQRGPGGPAGQSGPAGQYGRPDYDLPQRSEHYASFAEQDAAYTRPRPPGARDQFGPQDDTDPLNIVPLNIGNYS
jgi:preprotein translocase subunit SecG